MILQRQNRKFTILKVFITCIFNILIKINYWKWIVFKNLQWLLTQLVLLRTIMESQSYKTFMIPTGAATRGVL